MAATLTSAAGLLDELAEAVVAPVNRLKELKKEAEEFVASVRGGVTVPFGDPDYPSLIETGGQAGGTIFNPHDEVIGWSEHSPSVDRNNELLEQVAAEVAKLSAASADCVNGINALRTDTCIAPHEAVTAEQLIAAEGLPWGEIGKGDRSCSESVNDGMFEFGKSIVGGVVALGGFDIDNGWAQSADFAGKAWTGLASGLGALVITLTNPSAIGMAYLPDEAVPDWAEGAQSWYRGNLENIVGGIVGTPEQWEEDPVAAGTYAVLSIGTFFIPVAGQAGAAAKVTSALARAGTATQRLVALTGDSLRLSNGLTHTGALLTRLSTSLDGLSSGSAGMRSLDQVATALNDIPDVVPDNLVAARTAEGRTDAGDGSDSRASEMRPADTTHSVGGNAGSGSGTTVLERTDLGDGSIPADRGGSSDLPAGRDGSGDVPAGRSDGTDATPSSGASPDATVTPGSRLSGGDYPSRPLTHDEIADLPVVRDGTHLNHDGSLQPDTWYRTGEHEYVYHTNEHGHIDRVIAENLQLKQHDGRLTHDPNTLGKLPGDHAGHLLADWFGGSPKLDNIVSQLSDINLSKSKRIEKEWARTLTSDPPGTVSIDMRVITDPDSGRPTRFEIEHTVNGEISIATFTQ